MSIPSTAHLSPPSSNAKETPTAPLVKGPKRPSNSFFLYRSHKLAQLREGKLADDSAKRTQASWSKEISEHWRAEPREVREYYEALALAAKADHMAKYPDYSFKPVRKQPLIPKERKLARKAAAAAAKEAAASGSGEGALRVPISRQRSRAAPYETSSSSSFSVKYTDGEVEPVDQSTVIVAGPSQGETHRPVPVRGGGYPAYPTTNIAQVLGQSYPASHLPFAFYDASHFPQTMSFSHPVPGFPGYRPPQSQPRPQSRATQPQTQAQRVPLNANPGIHPAYQQQQRQRQPQYQNSNATSHVASSANAPIPSQQMDSGHLFPPASSLFQIPLSPPPPYSYRSFPIQPPQAEPQQAHLHSHPVAPQPQPHPTPTPIRDVPIQTDPFGSLLIEISAPDDFQFDIGDGQWESLVDQGIMQSIGSDLLSKPEGTTGGETVSGANRYYSGSLYVPEPGSESDTDGGGSGSGSSGVEDLFGQSLDLRGSGSSRAHSDLSSSTSFDGYGSTASTSSFSSLPSSSSWEESYLHQQTSTSTSSSRQAQIHPSLNSAFTQYFDPINHLPIPIPSFEYDWSSLPHSQPSSDFDNYFEGLPNSEGTGSATPKPRPSMVQTDHTKEFNDELATFFSSTVNDVQWGWQYDQERGEGGS